MPVEESEANNCWIVSMIVSRSEDVMTDSARVGGTKAGLRSMVDNPRLVDIDLLVCEVHYGVGGE